MGLAATTAARGRVGSREQGGMMTVSGAELQLIGQADLFKLPIMAQQPFLAYHTLSPCWPQKPANTTIFEGWIQVPDCHETLVLQLSLCLNAPLLSPPLGSLASSFSPFPVYFFSPFTPLPPTPPFNHHVSVSTFPTFYHQHISFFVPLLFPSPPPSFTIHPHHRYYAKFRCIAAYFF